ncbi:MAG: GspH/FimT family pseudopilin [Pseudomonadota bacterium]
MLKRAGARGVTLIELAIGLAILAILVTLALPNFSVFLHNTQIKNAAETTLSGLTLARNEAVRRNASVRFQLMSDLTNACAPSATALNWVVSTGDATGLCATAPGVDPPGIIQSKAAAEGSRNVTVDAGGNAVLIFNALGRVTNVAGGVKIDLRNPTGGTCEHEDPTNGTMRCLRIEVSTGGAAKICDPKVAATDTRACTLP